MAALDYLKFESGNPLTEDYCGLCFETLDLFGYFEHYRVRRDGTIWLTPTKMAPSGRMQKGIDAPELVKTDLPPVQILIDYPVIAISDQTTIEIQFNKGIVTQIKRTLHEAVSAA